MKRLLIILTLLSPLILKAQTDSMAAKIVDRYLAMLNIDAIPRDSMMVMHTVITYPGSTDTFTMDRYYMFPQKFRVDIFRPDGSRQTGLYSDGQRYYRFYDPKRKLWGSMTPETFYGQFGGLDFRGPLYKWRTKAMELSYEGKVKVKDEQLDAVKVTAPGTYTRTYMFQETGMLAVILESDETDTTFHVYKDMHIDWKCIHEYQRVGNTILPSLESFARKNELTVLRSEWHLEPRNNKLFNKE